MKHNSACKCIPVDPALHVNTDIKVVTFIPSLSSGGLTSVRLQQPQEQRYPRTEGKCLIISIWLDTSERVVTRYQFH